ncbi:hypothetical protein [Pacificimonas pallii]|nr:hypothetical protein [Pacificimonas pallii]
MSIQTKSSRPAMFLGLRSRNVRRTVVRATRAMPLFHAWRA